MVSDKIKVNNEELMLKDDEESRRILWYSAFLKPMRDYYSTKSAANIQQQSQAQSQTQSKAGARHQDKKAHRSLVMKLMLDELKRPARDAEGVERNERHQFGDEASTRSAHDVIENTNDMQRSNTGLKRVNSIQLNLSFIYSDDANKQSLQSTMGSFRANDTLSASGSIPDIGF